MEPRREGSKLRLKRSRRQEEESNQQTRSSPAWFQKQDLSSAERIWVTLLMAVDPVLDSSRLEKMSGLPPFLPKSFQPANPQPKPELFNAGATPFEWVPFPLYNRENIPREGSRNHEKEAVGLAAREKGDEGGSEPRTLEKTCFTATDGQTVEGSKVQPSIRHPTQPERGESIQRQNSAGPSTPTEEQQHGKRLAFQRLADGSATQGKRKTEEALGEEALAPSVVPAEERLRSANFAEPQKAEPSTEGLPDLDECPLCQMHFTGKWSRLDLDSHLAQCLSESTEDMVW